MTRWMYSLVAILLVQQSFCQNIENSPKAKAIPPTASGQIGVNPVTDLGPDRYQNIGPNTQYYQTDGPTTKWIGVNTEYLTDIPYTTTVNNQPTVTKAPAAVVAVTATAAGQGLEAGVVSIALSPKFADILDRLFNEAQTACGGKKKRQTCDINERFAQRVAEETSPGGAFDFIGPESRALMPIIVAGDVTRIVGTVKKAGPIVAIGVTYILFKKLRAFTLSFTSVAPAGTINEGDGACPADAPKGVDAPLCRDTDCKGDDHNTSPKCVEGKYKGCDCLITGTIVGVLDTDTASYDDGLSWLDIQQKVLNDFVDQKSESSFCNHGASPRGGRIPKAYCNCGDDTRKSLTYSVASSTASPYNPCPYTTNDGPTVTFQPESTAKPSATPAVACASKQERWFSSNDAFKWISEFCNNKDGRLLKLRPAQGDLIDASSQVFNGNQDPYVRIYAYLDNACSEKKTMVMSIQECVESLDTLMYDCDKDSDKKMGGSVAINCQWFNIAAVKGPGNPTCNGIPSENSC